MYSEHFKIFDGNRTVKYEQGGHLFMDSEHMVEIPLLSSAEIKVSISLARQGSTVKARYLVLSSSLYSGKHYSIHIYGLMRVYGRSRWQNIETMSWICMQKKKQITNKIETK